MRDRSEIRSEVFGLTDRPGVGPVSNGLVHAIMNSFRVSACPSPKPCPADPRLIFPHGDGGRQDDLASTVRVLSVNACQPAPTRTNGARYNLQFPLGPGLGGHLKTGQSWTGQNRPVGRAPQARRFYRIGASVRKSAAAGGVAAKPAGDGAGVVAGRKWLVSGDAEIWAGRRSSILEALGRSPIWADRVMRRSAHPGGGCASSGAHRSGHGRDGATDPGRRRRRRCRRGACPSPRRDGST